LGTALLDFITDPTVDSPSSRELPNMGDYNATAQPQWLNTSDETGLLSAASLVGLLTIPGMAIM
jgi:hypothetical protein